MSAAIRQLLRKSVAIGLAIELCMLGLLYLSSQTANSDRYDPKPFSEALYFGFHMPALWLLRNVNFGFGGLPQSVVIAIMGWVECSVLVWMAVLMSKPSSRNTTG